MRDLAFFRRDIWDLTRKQGREAGITTTSGSGISCFYGVGIRDFNFYATLSIVIDQRKNHKLAETSRIAVSGFK